MTAQHWFEPIADHLGSAYLRYSFTKGTRQEVGFLAEHLGLGPGSRLLDVGCGPGRHAHELARRGVEVVGVDISERFVELARRDAPPGATFVRADARALAYDREFDVAMSLCQGGFGLLGGPGGDPDDEAGVLAGMARAVRPGGHVVVSAFSAYFQVRVLGELPASTFDAATGVHHEHTEVRDEQGRPMETELWTTCYTPRELRLLARSAGLEPAAVWSVDTGDYAARAPDLDHAEFLLVARRP